jgi:hypothetical protein
MNISKLLNITRKQPRQDRNGKARRAISALRELGYTMPQIRAGLIKMHGVNIRRLHRQQRGMKPGVLYKAAQSKSLANAQARAALSEALGLTEEELFPEIKPDS